MISEATREKLRISHRGKKQSFETIEKRRAKMIGHPSGMLGKHQSKNTKQLISLAMIGKKHSLGHRMTEQSKALIGLANVGEKCFFWKGGITKEKYRYLVVRHERKMANGGYHTEGEWQNLKAQYNWTCPSCHRNEFEAKLTKDHIIPISKGGSDNIENIQPLCRSCNSRKNNKIINYKMFSNEQELIDAGYVKTPEVAHTGMGDGKVYEKIVSEIDGDTQVDSRTYFVVMPDGSVDVYEPGVGIKATASEATASEATASEATAVQAEPATATSEDSANDTNSSTGTAPEAQAE